MKGGLLLLVLLASPSCMDSSVGGPNGMAASSSTENDNFTENGPSSPNYTEIKNMIEQVRRSDSEEPGSPTESSDCALLWTFMGQEWPEDTTGLNYDETTARKECNFLWSSTKKSTWIPRTTTTTKSTPIPAEQEAEKSSSTAFSESTTSVSGSSTDGLATVPTDKHNSSSPFLDECHSPDHHHHLDKDLDPTHTAKGYAQYQHHANDGAEGFWFENLNNDCHHQFRDYDIIMSILDGTDPPTSSTGTTPCPTTPGLDVPLSWEQLRSLVEFLVYVDVGNGTSSVDVERTPEAWCFFCRLEWTFLEYLGLPNNYLGTSLPNNNYIGMYPGDSQAVDCGEKDCSKYPKDDSTGCITSTTTTPEKASPTTSTTGTSSTTTTTTTSPAKPSPTTTTSQTTTTTGPLTKPTLTTTKSLPGDPGPKPTPTTTNPTTTTTPTVEMSPPTGTSTTVPSTSRTTTPPTTTGTATPSPGSSPTIGASPPSLPPSTLPTTSPTTTSLPSFPIPSSTSSGPSEPSSNTTEERRTTTATTTVASTTSATGSTASSTAASKTAAPETSPMMRSNPPSTSSKTTTDASSTGESTATTTTRSSYITPTSPSATGSPTSASSSGTTTTSASSGTVATTETTSPASLPRTTSSTLMDPADSTSESSTMGTTSSSSRTAEGPLATSGSSAGHATMEGETTTSPSSSSGPTPSAAPLLPTSTAGPIPTSTKAVTDEGTPAALLLSTMKEREEATSQEITRRTSMAATPGVPSSTSTTTVERAVADALPTTRMTALPSMASSPVTPSPPATTGASPSTMSASMTSPSTEKSSSSLTSSASRKTLEASTTSATRGGNSNTPPERDERSITTDHDTPKVETTTAPTTPSNQLIQPTTPSSSSSPSLAPSGTTPTSTAATSTVTSSPPPPTSVPPSSMPTGPASSSPPPSTSASSSSTVSPTGTSSSTTTTEAPTTPSKTASSSRSTGRSSPSSSSSTTVPTTTTSAWRDCTNACPSGYEEGENFCYVMAPPAHAVMYSYAGAYCRRNSSVDLVDKADFASSTNLALFRKMLSGRSAELFWINVHFAESVVKTNMVPLANLTNSTASRLSTSLMKITKKLNMTSGLCRAPKYCAPLKCNVSEIYAIFGYLLPPPPADLPTLVDLETVFSQPCLPPATNNITTKCGKVGQWELHPTRLACVDPDAPLPQKPEKKTRLNKPIRKSCDDCFEKGTDNCTEVEGGYKCNCKEGWTKNTCWLSPNVCRKNTCNGNGKCVKLADTFECKCDVTHAGETCQIKVNEATLFGTNNTVPIYSAGAMIAGIYTGNNIFLLFLKTVTKVVTMKESTDPMEQFQQMRIYCLAIAGMSVAMFARPSLFLLDAMARRVAFFTQQSMFALAFYYYLNEAIQVYWTVSGQNRNEWRRDWKGRSRWYMSFWLRMFWPIAFNLLCFYQAAVFGWDNLTSPWTTMGLFGEDDGAPMLLLIIPFWGCALSAAIYGKDAWVILRDDGYKYMEICYHAELNHAPREEDKVRKVARNIFFVIWNPLILAASWFVLCLSYYHHEDPWFDYYAIVLGLVYSAFSTAQGIITNSNKLETLLVKVVFRWLPDWKWLPRVTPLSRLTREEVNCAYKKEKLKSEPYPFTPTLTYWYLREEERYWIHRGLTMTYCRERYVTGDTVEECIAKATQKQLEIALDTDDPQRFYWIGVWAEQIRLHDTFVIQGSRGEVERPYDVCFRAMTRPMMTPRQKEEEERQCQRYKQLADILQFTPVDKRRIRFPSVWIPFASWLEWLNLHHPMPERPGFIQLVLREQHQEAMDEANRRLEMFAPEDGPGYEDIYREVLLDQNRPGFIGPRTDNDFRYFPGAREVIDCFHGSQPFHDKMALLIRVQAQWLRAEAMGEYVPEEQAEQEPDPTAVAPNGEAAAEPNPGAVDPNAAAAVLAPDADASPPNGEAADAAPVPEAAEADEPATIPEPQPGPSSRRD